MGEISLSERTEWYKIFYNPYVVLMIAIMCFMLIFSAIVILSLMSRRKNRDRIVWKR